jgi:predicted nucleic-acid-binding Zn-ribbon protein
VNEFVSETEVLITGIGHKFSVQNYSEQGLKIKCDLCGIEGFYRKKNYRIYTKQIVIAGSNCKDIFIKDILM